jgi:7-carboxy-7-deazaguanine synthase
MLRVNEIFGPTIQGEGKYAGRHCLFCRVWECNQTCYWCDTPYTWAYTHERAAKHRDGIVFSKEENMKEMTSLAIIEELQKLWPHQRSTTIIVISGGEPMMQMRGIYELAEPLQEWGHEVHIETAGTIAPTRLFNEVADAYTVSPKLANSGNLLKKRYKPDVIDIFADNQKATFKFVVTRPADLHEIDQMVARHAIHPSRVYIMPEGITSEHNIKVAKSIVEDVKARGYGLSMRSHIMLWEDERGR